jgi:hypothetical protein
VYAQLFPNCPVPVGAKTITPTIPYPQYKPRAGRKQHGDQMQLSCFSKGPTAHVKKREYGMKNKKENIENVVSDHNFRMP